jgi:hypothetical protein
MATDAGDIKAVRECSSLTLRPPGRGRWYDMKDQGIPAGQIVHLLDFLVHRAEEADRVRETPSVRQLTS